MTLFGLTVIFALVLSSFRFGYGDGSIAMPKVKMSKKLDALVKNKCYGCHNPDGKSDKAKAALLWDELGNLSVEDLSEIMGTIQKVVGENEMPPKMMVEKNPEKALTEQESAQLVKWAGKLEKKANKYLAKSRSKTGNG